MKEPFRKASSLRNAGGVAAILEQAKQEAITKIREKLTQRAEQGRSNLAADEIETISRMVGMLVREICADSIAEAYQMGVNANARQEDFERDTKRPEIKEPDSKR